MPTKREPRCCIAAGLSFKTRHQLLDQVPKFWNRDVIEMAVELKTAMAFCEMLWSIEQFAAAGSFLHRHPGENRGPVMLLLETLDAGFRRHDG